MTDGEKYNGWTNYETWAVHLWLTNEEGSYNSCHELAANAKKDATESEPVRKGWWTEEQGAKFPLADRLESRIKKGNPLIDQPSLYSDLLGAAVGRVDWYEIAEAFLEED